MDSSHFIEHHFRRIGGRVAFVERLNPRQRVDGFAIDVHHTRAGECFMIQSGERVQELLVLQALPKEKHLLLFVKVLDYAGKIQRLKFLCGHDERHWFVAGVNREATTVASAKECLKPDLVKDRQTVIDVKNRNSRRNAAFVRQGEWFFVPAPKFDPGVAPILRHEPINRVGGKPHIVEELCRIGGVTVYVSRQHPSGVTEEEYRHLLETEPQAKSWKWQVMRRDMDAYGRGRVTHRDHKTVVLKGWHRILLSEETTMTDGRLAQSLFLD